jgi:hypothetical protein
MSIQRVKAALTSACYVRVYEMGILRMADGAALAGSAGVIRHLFAYQLTGSTLSPTPRR